MNQAEINFAAALIERIDSGERNIFLDSVNTENQIKARIFGQDTMLGVLYSSVAYKGLRISIAFKEDVDAFNKEIADCVRASLEKAGSRECRIWVRNENRRIIKFLKEEFHIKPDCGPHYYASIEFIMRRENFDRTMKGELEIRPYEKRHINKYLRMLDHSMTFDSQPPRFRRGRKYHKKYFAECARDNAFEAFWKDSRLAGLYWRKDAEIDTLAVADNQQRKGYGTEILTRAISMAFEYTDVPYAYLYAVDWNNKGQSFYRKYGMEENGHSYGLRVKRG